jgi:hypothetical protein
VNTTFNHEQDHSGVLDGVTIHDANELFTLLDSFKGREPFVGELVGENGYMLKLGIGSDLGCVQYSPSDGDVPYLMAVAPGVHSDDEFVDFLIGNTPTSIPKRNCLPFEVVKKIAAYFIETGERSSSVSWEEV